MKHPVALLALVVFCALLSACSPDEGKVVIAHRGASGYLPEHTFAAKVLAYAQGADYLEQDVVLTRDGAPIIVHDIYLEGTTDVAARFPGRARPDGHYYAIDFTLDEIRQLNAHERVDAKTGKPVFPNRFGLGGALFEVHTLDEEIELVQRLNRESGRNVGLYVEIKKPAFHEREGQDVVRAVAETLASHGYKGRDAKCWVQCFDSAALRRLRGELGCTLRQTQLIGESGEEEDSADDYAAMTTPEGLAEVAKYADAIGPSILQVLSKNSVGIPVVTDLTENAHKAGLLVHPYTLRRDDLPKGINEGIVLALLFDVAEVDGVFTDFPDSSVAHLR